VVELAPQQVGEYTQFLPFVIDDQDTRPYFFRAVDG